MKNAIMLINPLAFVCLFVGVGFFFFFFSFLLFFFFFFFFLVELCPTFGMREREGGFGIRIIGKKGYKEEKKKEKIGVGGGVLGKGKRLF